MSQKQGDLDEPSLPGPDEESRVGPPLEAKNLGASSLMWQEVAVVALALIWGLFLRLPFFFPATIDWDESTFTLVGQGILDGLLPYDVLWENKPPLVFVFFAAVISLFGKTIVGIRFAGYLWITATAYLTYRSAYALTSERTRSIAAALLFITATSLLSPGVMSESLALLPLIGSLLLLLTSDRTMASCFFVGVLIGTATMFRTNFAYLAVLVAVYLVLYPPVTSVLRIAQRGAMYATGGMIVVFITAIPYFKQDKLRLWFDSIFLVPLKYSEHLHSLVNVRELTLKAFGVDSRFSLDVEIFLLGFVLWIGGFFGVSHCVRNWMQLSQAARNQVVILLIFLFGGVASVFLTGRPRDHYLVLLTPFFAIFVAITQTSLTAGNQRVFVELVALLVVVVSVFLFISDDYSALAQRIKENKTLSYGEEYEIARYLRRENPDHKPIFVLSDIIVYWFVGQYPGTRLAAHPSNINKQFLVTAVEGPNATCEGEMGTILSQQPAFIVKGKDVSYLKQGEAATKLLNDTLDRDYVLANAIGGQEIYRRK